MSIGIAIQRGQRVQVDRQEHVILRVIDFETVVARDVATDQTLTVQISKLEAISAALKSSPTPVGIERCTANQIQAAEKKLFIIQPLLNMPPDQRTREFLTAHARQHVVSVSSICRWLYRYNGTIGSLIQIRRRDAGIVRRSAENQRLLDLTIDEFFNSNRKPSINALLREIRAVCRQLGMSAPSRSTVYRWINRLGQEDKLKRRISNSRRLAISAMPGIFGDAPHPWAVIQIDHTLLDIILSNALGQSIGRPWVTVAIDVYSRMILGIYISLDPPSAHSVGMCLTHAMLPKDEWLAARGFSHLKWPCFGLPDVVPTGSKSTGELLVHRIGVDTLNGTWGNWQIC
jgi:putative transposase